MVTSYRRIKGQMLKLGASGHLLLSHLDTFLPLQLSNEAVKHSFRKILPLTVVIIIFGRYNTVAGNAILKSVGKHSLVRSSKLPSIKLNRTTQQLAHAQCVKHEAAMSLDTV